MGMRVGEELRWEKTACHCLQPVEETLTLELEHWGCNVIICVSVEIKNVKIFVSKPEI